jgi:transcriptional regulator with XRE-family HTH domain
MVGCSGSAVTMWESGDTFPRLDRLGALAKALDASLDDLLGRRAA